MKRERKEPTTLFALTSFLLIIAVLVILINLGVNTTISIFLGAVVAVGIALALGISWDEIEKTIKNVIADSTPTFLIVLMVGMLVAVSYTHLDVYKRQLPARK